MSYERFKARQAGRKWYESRAPCEYGHEPIRRVKDCKCKGCLHFENLEKADTRRNALKNGRADYKSAKPCPHGHNDRRRASDGACLTCAALEARRQRISARRRVKRLPDDQRAMMVAAPDTVISQAAASAAGLAVYRTGEPCNRGHAAWRFTDGGDCTECGSE